MLLHGMTHIAELLWSGKIWSSWFTQPYMEFCSMCGGAHTASYVTCGVAESKTCHIWIQFSLTCLKAVCMLRNDIHSCICVYIIFIISNNFIVGDYIAVHKASPEQLHLQTFLEHSKDCVQLLNFFNQICCLHHMCLSDCWHRLQLVCDTCSLDISVIIVLCSALATLSDSDEIQTTAAFCCDIIY